MKCTRLATVLLAALAVTPAFAQYGFFGWKLSEFQPDIRNGGRANTIAVNPADNNNILVASESGGLFRSSDRGLNWHHIDSLPEFSTNAVTFVPGHAGVVIATVNDDFRTASGGGIWRSTDNSVTWSRISVPGAPARPSAYEISIAPDSGTIFAGLSSGIAISTDQGATWTRANPFAGTDERVFSVVAQSGGHVLAAGPAGIRRSTDSGATWSSPSNNPGGIWDIHTLGASPFSSAAAYASIGGTTLWYTEDSGNTWTQITAAPSGGGGCGGIAFVKATGSVRRPRPGFPFLRSVTLYAGNRCGISKLVTPWRSGTTGFDYTGAWTGLNIDHGDTRDLAFTSAHTPLLLATDGGLHNTADGGANWTFVGGGHHGYNALQVTEVKDQWITALARHDLYFGTQDNDIWASTDDGTTWPNHVCCEGFFIERQHRVATSADSKITGVTCGACFDWISDPALAGFAGWSDATTPPAGNPKIVRKSFHVQGVDTGTTFSKGLAVTTNLGTNWSQYAAIAEDRRDLPKLSDPWVLPVLYQAIRTGWYGPGGFEINQLVRVRKNLFGGGTTVTYPAMANFGGLGINPTMFAWYQVFGVDPGNTMHVIAPDVINEKIMETWDGGDNWTEIPSLTSQVSGSGTFLFRSSIFPQASAVSFSPDDPHVVAIGTWQNGVFVSGDRGATWLRVPGSELATYITSIEWKNASSAVVSTYGRGLWRLSWGLLRPLPHFEEYCKLPCIIWPWNNLIDPAERYTDAVLVFDGGIQGAKITNGAVREIYISPGASAVFFSNAKQSKIKVTTTAKRVGFGNVKAPAGPEGTALRGLTLDARGRVLGAAFTKEPLKMFDAGKNEQEEKPVGKPESPTAGKPYIELQIGRSEANRVVAGQPFTIAARAFPKNVDLEIDVDDRPVEKARVTENGTFVVRVVAPATMGLHSVTVRDAQTRQVIDGANFIVTHEDRRKEQR